VTSSVNSFRSAPREADPGDRRKVVVTPSLEAIQDKLVPLCAEQGERMQSLLATRSLDELRTISAFLEDAVAQD